MLNPQNIYIINKSSESNFSYRIPSGDQSGYQSYHDDQLKPRHITDTRGYQLNPIKKAYLDQTIQSLLNAFKSSSDTNLVNQKFLNYFRQTNQHLPNGYPTTFWVSPENDQVNLDHTLQSLDNIKYKINGEGVYEYHDGHYYVNFANNHFGGGTIGRTGFVQEEILLLGSSIVLLLFYLQEHNDDLRRNREKPPLPEDVKTFKLSDQPLLVFTQRVALNKHEYNAHPDLDGWTLYGYLGVDKYEKSGLALESLFQPIDPLSVYYISMAASDRSEQKGKPYSVDELKKSWMTAYKAYSLAINQFRDAPEDIKSITGNVMNIHTGNWGAGVFGHHLFISYIIQKHAICFAADIAEIDFQVNAKHYPVTTKGHSILTSCEELLAQANPHYLGLSPNDFFKLLKEQSDQHQWY